MKYYRVIKENPLWEVGAILSNSIKKEDGGRGYLPIEIIWNKNKSFENEYLSEEVIENQPEYFEQVFESKFDKLAFVTAEQLKEFYNKFKK